MIDSFNSINTDLAQDNNLKKFNTYFYNPFFDPFIKGYAFVFMTRPSLFIYPTTSRDPYENLAYNNMCRDPFFAKFINGETMNSQDSTILKQLSFSKILEDGVSNNFIPAITNMTKNFESQDVTMESEDMFSTKQGHRMLMPTFKTSSEAAGQFSLMMDESSNLDIINMMGIWVNYISNITDGTFSAHPAHVKARVIDYMSSLYYFVLAPDGKTLKYWAKYTGVWPTNIPYNSLSYSRGMKDIAEVALNFNYNSKEDMDPQILEDFNKVSLNLESAVIEELTGMDYFSQNSSRYLKKSIVYQKYREQYPSGGINPIIVAKDNSSEISVLPGTLSNKFQLLFPIDLESNYMSIKTGDSGYYNENIFIPGFDEV